MKTENVTPIAGHLLGEASFVHTEEMAWDLFVISNMIFENMTHTN